jgi:hypothetical protein
LNKQDIDEGTSRIGWQVTVPLHDKRQMAVTYKAFHRQTNLSVAIGGARQAAPTEVPTLVIRRDLKRVCNFEQTARGYLAIFTQARTLPHPPWA